MGKIEKMKNCKKKYIMVFYTSLPLTEDTVLEYKTSFKNPKEDEWYSSYCQKEGKLLAKCMRRKVCYGIIENPRGEWKWNENQ